MPKHITWLVLLATLLVAGCGKTATSPEAGNRIISEGSAEAAQLDILLGQDPSLQELQKAGYTPVAVITDGTIRIVTYHLCGTMSAEACSKSRPDVSHPVVALFTNQVGLNDPISFNGEFRLIFKEPSNLQPLTGIKPDAYKLYCHLWPSSQAQPGQALPAGYIGRFAEGGTYFGSLEYGVQEGKVMTHTRKDNDGSTWECTASTKLV